MKNESNSIDNNQKEKEKEKEKEIIKIKNDIIYKWLTGMRGKPLIYLINELFNEHYPLEGVGMELVSDKPLIDVEFSIVIMDTLISMEYDNEQHKFHLEMQTLNDKNIRKRMLDYGFRYAIDDMDENSGTLKMPKQTVIFIEKNKNIEDFVSCKLLFYNYMNKEYDTYYYKISTYKIFNKKIEELKEKHLSILLPFKVSELNKRLKRAKTKEDKDKILQELEKLIHEIMSCLKDEYKAGYLTYEQYEKVMNALLNLSNFFYKKLESYEKVEAKLAMEIKSTLTEEDRKVIREESEEIGIKKGEEIGIKKGEEIGIKKGEEIGIKKGVIETARRMLRKGSNIEFIMDVTGLSREEIETLK